MTALLDIVDLHVWFDLPDRSTLHAVRGVNLTLEPGDRVGLVGESGCGKTTTAMATMGLLPSSASVAGRVLFRGDDMLAGGETTFRPHRWVDIAMVFQGAMNSFNPVQTVGAQIDEALRLHLGVSRPEARARTSDLLEAVGIAARRASRYPHEFSGGMRQRAALAMALACEPAVLVADEPTTALDVMVQAQILQLLDTLCSDFGLALVLVTHDLAVVAQLCDRAAVMYAGEVVEEAPIAGLLHDPRHPYSQLLFAATPDLDDDGPPPAAIPGAPPRLDRPLRGCPFQPRCPRAFDRCMNEVPAFVPVEPARSAACHLNELEVRAT